MVKNEGKWDIKDDDQVSGLLTAGWAVVSPANHPEEREKMVWRIRKFSLGNIGFEVPVRCTLGSWMYEFKVLLNEWMNDFVLLS